MAAKTTASLCFSRLIKCESYQILIIFHDMYIAQCMYVCVRSVYVYGTLGPCAWCEWRCVLHNYIIFYVIYS